MATITPNDRTSAATAAAALTSNVAVVITGCLTAVLVSTLIILQRERKRRKRSAEQAVSKITKEVGEANQKKTVKEIDPVKYPGGQISIYYATQTGTAESFAQQLEREGHDHGFSIRVIDLEDVKEVQDFLSQETPTNAFDGSSATKSVSPSSVATTRAIFLAATYGEGEPTDNSNEIVQHLKEMTPSDSAQLLKGLDYCVFGLGNRQYDHYNAMGKFFDTSLEELGGQRIMPLGLGDDDADLEGDFETWKDQLWMTLKQRYCPDSDPNNNGKTKSSSLSSSDNALRSLPDCEYAIIYHPYTGSQNQTPRHEIPLDQVHGSGRSYFTAINCPVTKVQELRRSPAEANGNGGSSTTTVGSTKHVEIDISKAPSNFQYQTADNLGVLPLNDPKVVESVASALGYDLEAMFSLEAAPGHEWHGHPFPMPLTIRDCLTQYLDLTSPPRRSDLKLLAQYATDKLDRQALLRLSSKEGKQEYKEKILQGFVGMVDLLKLCPSLTIPLEHLISVCRLLLPRYYTISSSSLVHPKSIHLTVAVTQQPRPDGHSIFQGVCSTHLAQRRPQQQDTIRIVVRPSTFRLPKDPSRPILMIGPGTGIAPMRAFLQERYHQKYALGEKVGRNVLYFGCQNRTIDYLYHDELQAWQDDNHPSDGSFLTLHTAFSREVPGSKVYVQHLLEQHANETWELIHAQQAYIYVCGGVKMGHDVTETLKGIVVSEGQMSFDKAKDYLATLASSGRFVQELWA